MLNRTVALTVAALTLGACTSGPPAVDVAADVDPVVTARPSPSPSASPSPSPSPTPQVTVSAAPATRPPLVAVHCPADFTFPFGETARVTFGASIRQGSGDLISWSMAYGDGGAYSADSAESAKRDVYWHVYEDPGVYTPELTVAAADGEQGVGSCTFEFSWEDPPPSPSSDYTVPVPPSGGGGTSSGDGWTGCHYNGIPMWGKVKIVDRFADVTVRAVDRFEDLKVQEVDRFPNSCGQWQIVDRFEDFSVKFVDRFEDFTIRLVDRFPGR